MGKWNGFVAFICVIPAIGALLGNEVGDAGLWLLLAAVHIQLIGRADR